MRSIDGEVEIYTAAPFASKENPAVREQRSVRYGGAEEGEVFYRAE